MGGIGFLEFWLIISLLLRNLAFNFYYFLEKEVNIMSVFWGQGGSKLSISMFETLFFVDVLNLYCYEFNNLKIWVNS